MPSTLQRQPATDAFVVASRDSRVFCFVCSPELPAVPASLASSRTDGLARRLPCKALADVLLLDSRLPKKVSHSLSLALHLLFFSRRLSRLDF